MQHHRAWGVAGVSLATAMVFVGFATAIASMHKDVLAGHAHEAQAFAIVPVTSAVEFAVMMIWAVATVKDGETHKRLMMLNTMQILQAPIGRFFFLTVGGGGGAGSRPGSGAPAPVLTTVGAGVAVGLLILAAVIYDWRKRGRPHPVYVVGGIVVMAIMFLRVPLAETPQWQAIAQSLGSFATYR
jgi:hypothetical protein